MLRVLTEMMEDQNILKQHNESVELKIDIEL